MKEAVRTDKVFLPQLMKQSIQFKVQLETIEVKEVVGIYRIRDIFGRFCFFGTRDRYPKKGDRARSIGFRKLMNVASEIRFVYIAKYNSLQIKLK